MPSRSPETMELLGPVVAALVFVTIMSLVREPARRNLNALIVAGAGGVYLSGGFGLWELPYVPFSLAIAYWGLRTHRAIGIGWLLHASWDVAHHLYGNVIWPFMPSSSMGCMIFDTLIAVWFLADAPSVFVLLRGGQLRMQSSR